MAIQSKEIYVNLPVENLEKSKAFFGEIGFGFNEERTDERGACMIVGPNIFVMLLEESFFKTFTGKEISDSAKSTEVITAITADSRADVDEMVNRALAAGGAVSQEKMDNEYMYGWSFQDIDGHLWEVFYALGGEEDDDIYG